MAVLATSEYMPVVTMSAHGIHEKKRQKYKMHDLQHIGLHTHQCSEMQMQSLKLHKAIIQLTQLTHYQRTKISTTVIVNHYCNQH